MHRESDFHGNAKWYTAVNEPDSPLRQAVGDLGESVMHDFDSRALPAEDGVAPPFVFASSEPEGPKLSTASSRLGDITTPPGIPPGMKLGRK